MPTTLRRLTLCFAFSLCLAGQALASGPLAYLTNYWVGTVTVIDTSTDTLVTTIHTGGSPFSAAVNPAATRVYVAHSAAATISVIDTNSNVVVASIDIQDPGRPAGEEVVGALGVAVHPDGSRVYVTETTSNPYHGRTVAVIDASTNAVIRRIPVGIFPHGVAFNPSGKRAYVANWGQSTASGTLSVIDTTTDEVIATITGVGDVNGVVVSPSGTSVYATDWTRRVLVIDATTNAVVGQIDVDAGATGIAVNPAGTRVYAADSAGVKVIDTSTNTLIASILDLNPVARGFTGVAVDPSGTKVYATRYAYQYAAVIDATTNTIAEEHAWGGGHNAYGIFIWRPNEIVDTTPPVVTPTIAGTLGNGGWYTSDVTVAWEVSDQESAVSSTSGCESVSVLSDTVGTTFTCEATSAGGTSSSSLTIKRDSVAPIISVTAPSATVYALRQAVAANYSCTDGGSGVAGCAGNIVSGAQIPTASVGDHEFAVDATDAAGNRSRQVLTYVVAYDVCVLYDPSKAKKSGSTISITLQLCDSKGVNVSSAASVVTATGVYLASTQAPEALEDSGYANPDFNFRYDPTLGGGGGYTFNLSLKGFGQGTYGLTFRAGADPTTHTVQFGVK